MQVQKPRAWDCRKGADGFEIGRSLELDRAHEAANLARLPPFLHQVQQPLRIAHDIRQQPIDRPYLMRVDREGTLAPIGDAREIGDAGIERSLVDAENARAEFLQYP